MYRSKIITIQNKILANYDRQFKQKHLIKKVHELFRFKEVRFRTSLEKMGRVDSKFRTFSFINSFAVRTALMKSCRQI